MARRDGLQRAYKEKMKEISVLSLICSCLYPERKNVMGEFEGTLVAPGRLQMPQTYKLKTYFLDLKPGKF
ncbi:hypothetical protein NHX12_024077 [Muraenolepis orangiensis]|uniref:Uncharacterized protein n=1 Tax=Muraenolepis orangiensis TaxID=630683 RepID=A0A9Q0ES50_9TELE|nr:hypothetical protein NHX12_024077 [Muraenolepis orangiensis]